MAVAAPAQYIPRQPGEHWRTTGSIFNIAIDQVVRMGKGGKVQKITAAVCRYANDMPDDRFWNPREYKVTRASWGRLLRILPAAGKNRK